MYSGSMPVVHLARNGNRPAPAGSGDDPGPVDHIAFTADNYAELMERLKAAGASFEERAVPGGAAHQVFVHGPEGVRVEKPSEIEGALSAAVASGETFLVDVLIDPDENVWTGPF